MALVSWVNLQRQPSFWTSCPVISHMLLLVSISLVLGREPQQNQFQRSYLTALWKRKRRKIFLVFISSILKSFFSKAGFLKAQLLQASLAAPCPQERGRVIVERLSKQSFHPSTGSPQQHNKVFRAWTFMGKWPGKQAPF